MSDEIRTTREELESIIDVGSRLKAAETILEFQKEEIGTLKQGIEGLKDGQNALREAFAVQKQEFKNLVENMRSSARRTAWTVGTLLTVATIMVQLVIHYI